MNDLVWRNKYMKRKQNKKYTRQPYAKIITYALEISTETSKSRQILEANEMKVLRKKLAKLK